MTMVSGIVCGVCLLIAAIAIESRGGDDKTADGCAVDTIKWFHFITSRKSVLK
jgi:hypothetical protein